MDPSEHVGTDGPILVLPHAREPSSPNLPTESGDAPPANDTSNEAHGATLQETDSESHPLHQTHAIAHTRASVPAVPEWEAALTENALDTGFVRDHDPGAPRGQIYNPAVALTFLQHVLEARQGAETGLRVAEFGARDSQLGAFCSGLDGIASVHVSDHFLGWGAGSPHWLGGEEEWFGLWQALARDAGKLTTVKADLVDLPLSDASIDVAFCVSVLEHTYNQFAATGRDGDLAALNEIARVLGPGGVAVLTAWIYNPEEVPEPPEGAQRVGTSSMWHSGTLWLSESDLHARWIGFPGFGGLAHPEAACLQISCPHNDALTVIPGFNPEDENAPKASPAVFALWRDDTTPHNAETEGVPFMEF